MKKNKDKTLDVYEARDKSRICSCTERSNIYGTKPYRVLDLHITHMIIKCVACGATWRVENSSKLFNEMLVNSVDKSLYGALIPIHTPTGISMYYSKCARHHEEIYGTVNQGDYANNVKAEIEQRYKERLCQKEKEHKEWVKEQQEIADKERLAKQRLEHADLLFRRDKKLSEWNKLRGKKLRPTSISFKDFFKEFIEAGFM